MNKIDFTIVKQDWKRNIKDSYSYHSADIGPDHSLVMVKVLLYIKTPRYTKRKSRAFDVPKVMYNININMNH